MNAADVAAPAVTYRPVHRSEGAALLAVNRACPIEADVTFRFDREPDFFAWPSRVFESFEYVGIYCADELVGYCLAGFRHGWVGRAWGRWGYAGDVRLLPAFRGRHLALPAMAALWRRTPEDIGIGFLIVKRGNVAGGRLAGALALPGLTVAHAGILEVCNLPVLPILGRLFRSRSRPIRLSDVSALTALLRRDLADRLFAPRLTEAEVATWCDGSGPTQALVIERASSLRGAIVWQDLDCVRRTTIVDYPPSRRLLRAAWTAAARIDRRICPLPGPGESVRAITVSHLVAEEDDPITIRALLAATIKAHEARGLHFLHACAMRGEPLLRALRGLPGIGFCSDVWLLSRSSQPSCSSRAGCSGQLSGSNQPSWSSQPGRSSRLSRSGRAGRDGSAERMASPRLFINLEII
jgi:hypothetical protein